MKTRGPRLSAKAQSQIYKTWSTPQIGRAKHRVSLFSFRWCQRHALTSPNRRDWSFVAPLALAPLANNAPTISDKAFMSFPRNSYLVSRARPLHCRGRYAAGFYSLRLEIRPSPRHHQARSSRAAAAAPLRRRSRPVAASAQRLQKTANFSSRCFPAGRRSIDNVEKFKTLRSSFFPLNFTRGIYLIS